MNIIDGKQLAANLRAEIAAGVKALKEEKGITPGLAVILVGNNPASVSYVTAKEKACTEAGMYSREIRLPETTTEEELVKLVKDLNVDPARRSSMRLRRRRTWTASRPSTSARC